MIAELNAEVPIRLELIKRCQGIPYHYEEYAYHCGKRHIINRVACIGGFCECGLPECGHRRAVGMQLHPHEAKSRGQGGRLSVENSIMVFNECHEKLQHNDVRLDWLD